MSDIQGVNIDKYKEKDKKNENCCFQQLFLLYLYDLRILSKRPVMPENIEFTFSKFRFSNLSTCTEPLFKNPRISNVSSKSTHTATHYHQLTTITLQ